MNKGAFVNLFLPFILFALISCTTSNQTPDKVAPDNDLSDFEIFTGLFSKQMTQLPDSLIKQFLQVDSLQIDKVWTYERVIFSDSIIGLVYKAACMAGGICERFVLTIFDEFGNKLSETEIGHRYADYGGSSELTYIFDNEIIEFKLKETELLEAEDGTDKVQVKLDTIYFKKIDLKSGQVRND